MGSSLRKFQTVGLVVLMLGILVGLFHEKADAGPPRLILYPQAPGGVTAAPYNVSGLTPNVSGSFFPAGTGSLGSVLTPLPFMAQQQGGNNIGLANNLLLNNLLLAPVLNPFPVIGGVGGKVGGIGLNGMYGGW